jgi:hypothetical protein
MAQDAQAPASQPAHAQLIQMGMGFCVSRILYAAAKLSLADRLAEGPKTAGELANETRTHAPSLYRLLRTLASLGVVREDVNQRFALKPLGEALKTGAPGSARATILALAGDMWYQGWQHILYCLETGKTGMHKAFGIPQFEYFSHHPEEAAYFNEAMIGWHGEEPPAVAAAYDFSIFNTVVDVGGGTGNLLTAVLLRYPGLRGVLAELPHVLERAQARIESRGLKDRCRLEPIDFFKSVPSGGDAYVLSHVIHDWTDAESAIILSHCRRAIARGGRVLIVETVMRPGNTPDSVKLLDIAMLVMPGGQERTEEEYRALLGQTGFRLARVVPTNSSVSVVEGIPV